MKNNFPELFTIGELRLHCLLTGKEPSRELTDARREIARGIILKTDGYIGN